jgi:hypothetical protein
MRQSIRELVDCSNHILLLLFQILLGKITVLNQLPCKIVLKLLEGRDSFGVTKEVVSEKSTPIYYLQYLPKIMVVMTASPLLSKPHA